MVSVLNQNKLLYLSFFSFKREFPTMKILSIVISVFVICVIVVLGLVPIYLSIGSSEDYSQNSPVYENEFIVDKNSENFGQNSQLIDVQSTLRPQTIRTTSKAAQQQSQPLPSNFDQNRFLPQPQPVNTQPPVPSSAQPRPNPSNNQQQQQEFTFPPDFDPSVFFNLPTNDPAQQSANSTRLQSSKNRLKIKPSKVKFISKEN
jgi:hypothetical protein